ncbi:hypothetical protein F0562_026065 [Nyssa sinensis]|uniref:IspG TIM-barrel domain-containing protein n=1 Tax=Nyssa sinensis TaxID=561372 RepID=A0A5J5B805_9ASTE|nr:hypothetical protein F0562_026065 [Nyssa sinensis]
MKASNLVVMVQAYRLLVAEMYVQGWDYPLHLGVTEAGEGEDGRMKSAIGIGTLLQDGLGDTIRVSLTEPPEEEIDPCRRLAKLGMRAADLQQGVAGWKLWPFAHLITYGVIPVEQRLLWVDCVELVWVTILSTRFCEEYINLILSCSSWWRRWLGH